jgi:hypothetical protein
VLFSLHVFFSLTTLTLISDRDSAFVFYFFATLISHHPERLDDGLLPSR